MSCRTELVATETDSLFLSLDDSSDVDSELSKLGGLGGVRSPSSTIKAIEVLYSKPRAPHGVAAHNVGLSVGERDILDSVALTAEQSNFWAAIGPSESGTASLASAVGGTTERSGGLQVLDVYRESRVCATHDRFCTTGRCGPRSALGGAHCAEVRGSEQRL